MPQRVSRNEFDEWKDNFITQQLFNFFRLEAELHRRDCLDLRTNRSFVEIGEEYYKRKFAAECYDALQTINYEDLFPLNTEDSRENLLKVQDSEE